MNVGIVFPHQLFEQNPLISKCQTIYLIEEYLFFKHYRFHQQKIAFHRASMQFYAHYLQAKKCTVIYIDALDELADIRKLLPHLKSKGITAFDYIDTTDNWLERRISATSETHGLHPIKHPTLLFINTDHENNAYFFDKRRLYQTDFYKHQRIKRSILLEKDGKPIGGKWTYDDENRLKYPKTKTPPHVDPIPLNSYYEEAFNYTETHFKGNYGQLNRSFIYPTTFDESKQWLRDFLSTRFSEFGAYEDAIVADQSILHHSVLTPMLNVGLLTPQFIVEETLRYASEHEIPINSLEGFVRQIIGWREFIRAVYELKGTEERTKNYGNYFLF